MAPGRWVATIAAVALLLAVLSFYRIFLPTSWAEPNTWPGPEVTYVLYGQSNASGGGVNHQLYTGPPGRAWLFDGGWRHLTDPLNADSAGGGSWTPLLTNALVARTGRSYGFVPGAVRGLDLNRLMPGPGGPYDRMMTRVRASHATVRAVLFWQGEGDVQDAPDREAYRRKLAELALAVERDMHAPLVVAEIGPYDGYPLERIERIRAAQRDCWEVCRNVLRGPSFADIQTTADGVHFGTDAEIRLAAERWLAALLAHGLD
jgi:hypothetical protein